MKNAIITLDSTNVTVVMESSFTRYSIQRKPIQGIISQILTGTD